MTVRDYIAAMLLDQAWHQTPLEELPEDDQVFILTHLDNERAVALLEDLDHAATVSGDRTVAQLDALGLVGT